MKKLCYVVTIPTTIESFFIPQLQYLANHGYKVVVICSPSNSLQEQLGDKIQYVPIEIPRGISVGGSLKAIKALKRIFIEERFDLIQYSTPNAAFYASIASKAVGCKVRNYHLMGLRYLGASGFGRKVLKTIEKITCNNSTAIECVSKSNFEMGISEGLFSHEKAVVVWNGSSGGVDLKRFDISKRIQWRNEIRAELGYEEDDFVFGFVGRLTRDKGINELLEAYFAQNSDSKLFLVGEMDETETLDNSLLMKAKKSNDIQFHDLVHDIERYYAAIDVLVLPSYREGFGNVVIEAGAVGTPAIVSNIPGPIDTIEVGKTALTIEVKNVDDLSEKMRQICKMDYRTMGENAARFAREKFDSEILCEKICLRKNTLLE